MSISYKTPAYFLNFSCLGSDCEDTCCRDWKVNIDRQHYALLQEKMYEYDDERNVFDKYIHLNQNAISGDYDYAFIRMDENGYCGMLDDNKLCSIHARHGVSVLGDVCTMFPRVIPRHDNTIELSGALSCPEVVRICIDEKLPLKLKNFKPSELPRSKNYPIQRDLSDLNGDFYLQ